MSYDVIIIGKGPAGLQASLYTSRGNLSTLIIGKESVLEKDSINIENFCCTEIRTGKELIEKGIEQVKSFGAHILDEEVVGIKRENDGFIVTTNKGAYRSKAIIIATGREREKVPIKNIDNFENKGVHYCAACDGFFYLDRKIGVLGFKDYALHELREFEGITTDITLYTNGNELDISEENRKYIEENNIRVVGKVIKSLEGEELLERLVFEDGTEERLDGLFVAYGSASSIDFARNLGIIVENGYIVVDKDQRTNIPGVFAAGDCTGGFAQVATAVGEGAIAGQKVKSYLSSLKG